jgi:hypothetical protein
MATPSTAKTPLDPALNWPWTTYRLWASTARYQRKKIDTYTTWSLWLAIGGAVLATGAEQFGSIAHLPMVAKALGMVAAGAVALAAFFSRQAQGDDRIKIWTRSRTAAESLKSCIFLYRAGAQPFDGADKAAQIYERTTKVINDMKGVEPRQPGQENVPDLNTLTVEDYIAKRAQDQIDWYNKRAKEHQSKADLCRGATTALMGIAALLTVASAITSLSVWAPVVATLITSITAHLKNQQYQMLTATYTATALRLGLLCGEWRASGKTDADKVERNGFIQRCEDTMSNENGSWPALWAKT